MSTPELSIPLTEDERKILTLKRNRVLRNVPLFAIGAIVLLAVLIVFHTLYLLIALPLFSLVLAMRALVSLLNFLKLSRDLKQGTKQMISGPVEAQNIDVTRTKDEDGIEGDASYRFWIQIGGKKVTVSEDQYYQFKKGDLAEAFIAPHSETVLGVNKETLRRPFS